MTLGLLNGFEEATDVEGAADADAAACVFVFALPTSSAFSAIFNRTAASNCRGSAGSGFSNPNPAICAGKQVTLSDGLAAGDRCFGDGRGNKSSSDSSVPLPVGLGGSNRFIRFTRSRSGTVIDKPFFTCVSVSSSAASAVIEALGLEPCFLSISSTRTKESSNLPDALPDGPS